MADQNLEEINRVIESLKKKITPTKEMMTEIAGEMHDSVINNFENEGADVPGGWPALKSATIKNKERHNAIMKILQMHGRMMKALHTTATDNEAVESNNTRYAAIQNFGGTINIAARLRTIRHRTDAKGNLLKQESNKNLLVFAKNSHKRVREKEVKQGAHTITIPARPFMVLTDKYRENIIAIIQRHAAG